LSCYTELCVQNVPLEDGGFDEWATGVLQDDIMKEAESDGHGSFASASGATTQSSGQPSASGASNSGAAPPLASDSATAPSSPEAGAPISDSNDVVQITIDATNGSIPTKDGPPPLPTIDAAAGTTASAACRRSSPDLALTAVMVLSLRFLVSPRRC